MYHYGLASNLHYFREEGGAGKEARVTVLLWLFLRANKRSRAWGGAEKIAADTGFGKERVLEALDWLKEKQAIEIVPRVERKGTEKKTRSDVYELTGVINLGNQTVPYLYNNEPEDEANGTENEPLDEISGTESVPLKNSGTVNEISGSVNGGVSSIYELQQYELKQSKENERTNEGTDRTDKSETDKKDVAEVHEGLFTQEEFRALLEKIKSGYEAKWQWTEDAADVLSKMIGQFPQYAHYIPSLIELTPQNKPHSMAMLYFRGALQGWDKNGYVPTHIRAKAEPAVPSSTPQASESTPPIERHIKRIPGFVPSWRKSKETPE